MTRLAGLFIALLFSVTPSVDMVCRALCTPQPMGIAASSCHDVVPATADGVLLSAMTCQRDTAAAPAAGATRTAVAPPTLSTAPVAAVVAWRACMTADLGRQAPRLRPSHGYTSTIVLRI